MQQLWKFPLSYIKKFQLRLSKSKGRSGCSNEREELCRGAKITCVSLGLSMMELRGIWGKGIHIALGHYPNHLGFSNQMP